MTTIKELVLEAKTHHLNGTMTPEIFKSIIERAKPLITHAPQRIGVFTPYTPIEVWVQLKQPQPLQHA